MSDLLFPEMNEADAAKKCLLEVWPDCPEWLLSDEMDFVIKAMIKFKQDKNIKSELEKAKELLKQLKAKYYDSIDDSDLPVINDFINNN